MEREPVPNQYADIFSRAISSALFQNLNTLHRVPFFPSFEIMITIAPFALVDYKTSVSCLSNESDDTVINPRVTGRTGR